MKDHTVVILLGIVLASCGSVTDDIREGGPPAFVSVRGAVAPGTADPLSSLTVAFGVASGLHQCEPDSGTPPRILPVDEQGLFSQMGFPIDIKYMVFGPTICLTFQLRDANENEIASAILENIQLHPVPVTSDTLFVQLP